MTLLHPPPQKVTRPAHHRAQPRTWTLVAVSLATFMTYLDNNIINVALPTIGRDLHLGQSGIEWVVSAYIVVFAGLLLAGGRLADVIGPKRVFAMGLGLFTISSLIAGLAPDFAVLVTARAAQGLGAALLTPTALAIISAAYPEPAEQARAVGIWSAVGALALAFGPLLGGFLSQDVTWHWIFYINVPLGILTLALGAWVIPGHRPARRRRLDGAGVVASSATLIALTTALIEGPSIGWTTPVVLGALALSAATAITFVAVERRHADPMLDVALFSDRVFTGGVVALMMWAFGLFGIYFYTSLYLQDVLGFSAIKAGTAFVPMALLMAAGAAVADRVAARIGAHRSVAAAMLAMGAGIASVTFLGAHSGFAALMPGFVVIGIGGGLTIPLTAAVLGTMPADRAGVASGVFNASREVAGLLGVTVIGVVLSARRSAELQVGHSPLAAFLSGYRLGLVIAAVLVALGGLAAYVALRVRPSTPVPSTPAPSTPAPSTPALDAVPAPLAVA